jgi:hypothetical protein
MVESIDKALTDHDHKEIFSLSKQGYNYISAISNYLIFQSNQGGLASFGNMSSLRILYKTIYSLQDMAGQATQLTSTQARSSNYFFQISEKITVLGAKLIAFHPKDAIALKALAEFEKRNQAINQFEEKRKSGQTVPLYRTEMTEAILERVLRNLPPKPWEKNMHKELARKLGMSINLSHRCIGELVKREASE